MIRTLLALLPPGSRRTVVLHQSLTVVSVVLRAVGVVLLVPLVGALFGAAPSDAWPWMGALAAVTVAGWIVDTAASRLGFDIGFGLLDHAQNEVAERTARIRLTWFTGENTSINRQAIAATGPDLVGLIVYLVTPILSAILLPLAIAIALLPINWVLGVAALAGVPILLGAFLLSGRLGRNADRVAADANADLTERIVEFARTQPALRAARRTEPSRSHVGEALERQHSATLRVLLMQVPGQLIFSLATQLTLVILAGSVTVLTVRGDLDVSEAIALVVVIVRYLDPFTTLSDLTGGVESSLTTLRRIRAVLEAPVDSDDGACTITGRAPRIELQDIRFWYGGDAPALDGVDLTFEPGTTTAIVGPSGSGKSTVLSLLAGLHTPRSGRILIDGIDIEDLDSLSRDSLAGMVFQHPYLFDGTIRENIRAGDPSADDTALAAAASLAQVDEVLARVPDGWDTRVGEGGSALSGGEKQRVSIARALLKPAPLLLVDEATSALDTENETAIVQALTDDPTPRTRVIVAHRLASIRTADRVVFLEQGKVVEEGTVEELLSAGGRFAEFWRQRDAASGWQLETSGKNQLG
ncbi:ABC transporter ATP-binding protein [Rhodococcus sp. HNM0563]|uniref:ABC transporter ATP-binding protein n=1 Tax=unclassified Rhodococcus (in: high G+C Gram-positive bacteria) TaxID=192944 RepID=UPI00146AA592|nr:MULTISPECIES: ABC transporter ATP-binding protein [unclassified Rhodococcus (in: high G+C Gram-positive bacteria)]MCK0091865.1 ABC transporter ATP-binding protein/permease [Rhodococcus sp. F64268]NLU64201.1 ABC transporter ATP-binding protein [Rhodococcus sp. HNM0563]